jgi:type II secretory pathway component PulF
MLSLGEVSGQLEKSMLIFVAQQTEYLQTHIQTLKVWLEPLCLCCIGAVVGVVLIALYLPIIELGKWV